MKTDVTDFERAKFMEKLLVESRKNDGVLLTDWESEFLASYNTTQQYHRWFTPGRRTHTDRLWARYGGELNLPHPDDTVVERPKENADPTGCEFWMRDEGRQRRCNDPATKQRQNGFRYCEAHAEQVQRDLKRSGQVMHLLSFP